MFYPRFMPLSDHERQVLAAMEAALEKEDPKLVSTLNGLPKGGKGLTLGALAFFGGLAILIGGLVSKSILLGALGFIVSLVGVVLIIGALPKINGKTPGTKSGKKSWSERAQDRWDQRDAQ